MKLFFLRTTPIQPAPLAGTATTIISSLDANIATAVETFAERGYARLGGIILNARDVPREAEKVEELACDLNTTIVGRLPRSAEVQEADALGLTVLEHAPSSGMADRYRELARHLVEACAATRPEPARGGFTF